VRALPGRSRPKPSGRGTKTHGHSHGPGGRDHVHDHDDPAHGEPPAGPALHRQKAHAKAGPIGAAVITVSSTRSEVNDESGAVISRAFEKAGHEVRYYRVVKDDVNAIQAALRQALSTPGVDVVVTNGGTGMARSDVTIEAVVPLFDKKADGWGDVFREISVKEIGTAAFLSRSVAGTVGGKWVVSIPGSPGAARTAMSKLLLPELEHMLWEARR
jgi:molybdenum cofactor biosynthesis protein B